MRTVVESDTAYSRWAIDALLECYVSWREECQAVRLAYQRWSGSGRDARWLAYAAYVAAIDREECAAHKYAEHVEVVSLISTRSVRSRPANFATTTITTP